MIQVFNNNALDFNDDYYYFIIIIISFLPILIIFKINQFEIQKFDFPFCYLNLIKKKN